MVVVNGAEVLDLERLRLGIARWRPGVELQKTGRNPGYRAGCNVGMCLGLGGC